MLKPLQDQFEALERGRLALIGEVRRLTPLQLNHKPGPNRWSILQDVQHLVLAERKTALAAGALTDAEKKTPDMLKAVLQVLDHDVTVDVPDPDMVPDGDADLEDLIRDWERMRQRLHGFLEDCQPEDLQRSAAHHAVAGPLTVTECLGLMASHFNHHCRRIEASIARG